jgi:hypothetical protein
MNVALVTPSATRLPDTWDIRGLDSSVPKLTEVLTLVHAWHSISQQFIDLVQCVSHVQTTTTEKQCMECMSCIMRRRCAVTKTENTCALSIGPSRHTMEAF